ncbi:protein of unknown function [Methylorubrum extorquens DM4]|uniref:Uncharacterized protein n=1 Tax=Methylorubrum extorquens (strain DSM 6343 / CIP 106787 / DM4) TaxID=661410 RepID=C7CML3_METED|nr:protein of unknown function [Methylorubrum extorquens DM4]
MKAPSRKTPRPGRGKPGGRIVGSIRKTSCVMLLGRFRKGGRAHAARMTLLQPARPTGWTGARRSDTPGLSFVDLFLADLWEAVSRCHQPRRPTSS